MGSDTKAQESVDDKLARISGRLQTRRDELRQRLEAAPELASLLEKWKGTFGPIRVSYVQVGEWQTGDPNKIYEIDGQPGVVVCPAPYKAPRRRSAKERRKDEAKD